MQRFHRCRAAACRMALLAAIFAAWLLPPAAAQDTLYEKLGGQQGVSQIVERMVTIVTTDDRVKADFDNINLDRLKKRLDDFICQLANGPCVYRGRPMAAAHDGLDLTRAKFNAVAEDLQTAMGDSGVPYWTQNRLMALLAPMQRDIVTR
jgi:hemoglobin